MRADRLALLGLGNRGMGGGSSGQKSLYGSTLSAAEMGSDKVQTPFFGQLLLSLLSVFYTNI